MERISAGRRARLQRALLAVFGLLSAIVLLAAGSAWALTSYVSGSLGRIDAGISGTPDSGPLNILVAGVDLRSGLTRREQVALHVGHAVSSNSDTLMVAHVTADHRHIRVVSLPRDSWVDIPGHGMNKINAAFGIGGPRLMVQTVERATGLTINDYVEVNFLGFVKIIDALGGVNICLPFAVNDHYTGLHLSAGAHHVYGITALKFARDRHSFGGSDLTRIADQQQLLSSLFSEAVSAGTLANPVRLARFLSALSSAVKVDEGFNLAELANQLRGIRPGDVSFTTVPLANTNYITTTGQSAVLWNQPAARALFAALRSDRPVAHSHGKRGGRHKRARPALTRRQVSIDVYNGTMIGGLSAETGAQLAALRFHVHGSALTWPTQDITQTLIEYPAGQRAAARLVHKVMPGAVLQRVPGLARIRIVLGVNGYTVTAPSTGQGQSQGATSNAPKTAAQDACH
jgi:LCP family protein required for cell wall assembly